ncbi:uncharacterized protein CMU_028630 [Cryptosporidium muris RN66]|uniref:Uncharacterized protein n=1 Tax=Cryptosporidium muris (strain RN66) TaxID=441375 RepID=B6AHU8_CRYMR|nr:uncharacterized protein CMU_028630 [Cryptosporidium muris RN66]EEA07789.1 hypothetical protein CMU_028630 [Cryptosporidium muris RN66]|eukprot:XP_002142138.1 hypothetical protein [Cryptosporidium muris RN66]
MLNPLQAKLWDTVDDNRLIKEKTKVECTLKDKTENENHNMRVAILNTCSDKSSEIKTTIVIHNPPGGKSSLTLG